MQVVDVLRDEALEEAALARSSAARPPVPFPGGKHFMGPVRLRAAEVVVEDLPDHRPGLLGMPEEELDLQGARIVLVPQPPGAAEGRDAAFHADARAGEGGEPAGSADEGCGSEDRLMRIVEMLWAFRQVATWCREDGVGSIPE